MCAVPRTTWSSSTWQGWFGLSVDSGRQDRCSFCAILARQRPFTILDENALVSMLVTHEQRGLGHVLVIPTQHRKTILDHTPHRAVARDGRAMKSRAAELPADRDASGVRIPSPPPQNRRSSASALRMQTDRTTADGHGPKWLVRALSCTPVDALGRGWTRDERAMKRRGPREGGCHAAWQLPLCC